MNSVNLSEVPICFYKKIRRDANLVDLEKKVPVAIRGVNAAENESPKVSTRKHKSLTGDQSK